MRERPPSAAPADVVQLLVQRRTREVAAFVLDPLPQVVGPGLHVRPHPPEVLLRQVAEVALRVVRGELPRRVVQHEDGGPESVLELFVHRRPPATRYRAGWYSPNTPRRASDTSPSVAPARSASRMGSSRFSVPRAVSPTAARAAPTAEPSRDARSARTRSTCAVTSASS